MPSPSALPLSGKMSGGETFSAFQRASDGAVMSAQAVREHLQQIQEQPARVHDQIDAEQEEAMKLFRADLEATVNKRTLSTSMEIEPELFIDREEASVPAAAAPAKPGKGKGKRGAFNALTNDQFQSQAQLPALQVHFDDDGRRQTVRAHAAVLTQDGAGLMLLTPLALEARYFPRPHSVVRITTKSFGERWVYCPRAGAHADFPGQGLSSYLLLEEEEARSFQREERLRAAREVLAQEESKEL